MRMMTVARVRWRPILSPSGPKNNPPSGRMTKATPKTANEESSEMVGSSEGKKTAPSVTARYP